VTNVSNTLRRQRQLRPNGIRRRNIATPDHLARIASDRAPDVVHHVDRECGFPNKGVLFVREERNMLVRTCVLIAASAALSTSASGQFRVPTNFGAGADAEVREFQPDANRGASNELATRIQNNTNIAAGGLPTADASDRNSLMYLKFDLRTPDLAGVRPSADFVNTTLRLTYRNNNLAAGRISDADGVEPNLGLNGLIYYGVSGANFDELAITYNNAPGISPDGDIGTVDVNASAVFLGSQDFPDPVSLTPPGGAFLHLPVGGALDFRSDALDAFIQGELDAGRSHVVIFAMRRNTGLPEEPATWKNFNYLFNPKEMLTLNNDTNWIDPDGAGPLPPTPSPWALASNANGDFSPQLIVPEPATLAAFAAATLLGLRRRH
jgi:hypothetical protein